MSSLCSKYGYVPDKEAIDRSLDLIASNLDNIVSDEIVRTCFSLMDLTSLHTTDSPESITKLMVKVNTYQDTFPDFPLPASVCVYPNLASIVRDNRKDSALHVTAVAGCFPTSQTFDEIKAAECRMAVESGADEVDIVLSLNAFLSGNSEAAASAIRLCRKAVDEAGEASGRKIVLKVIIESGLLSSAENIAEASFLAMEAGADFIKTSTGKVDVNATPMAAYVMCECVKKFYEKTGRKVGFKAAGGISGLMDALCYYSIVSTVLGREWLTPSLFRFGVSRLANSLISAAEQKTVTFF
ncbi:MAG: deoxyribose-phosphate aldolase [Candidatus Cryptobacteroides sp.]